MSEGNGFATRDLFVRKAPRRYKEIDVPNFGKVRIQSLSEGERSRYETAILSSKGGLSKARLEEARRKLIVLCVVDGNGKRVMADDDAGQLEHMDGADAATIYDACREHCGFEAKDIEDLVKNSESVRVEDSQSA